MQFNKESSDKKNKLFYICSVTLLIVLAFPLFFDFSGHSQTKVNLQTKISGSLMEIKLQKADSNISFAPDVSEQLSTQVLNLSLQQNQWYYQTRALIILGKIKNLKGKQSEAFKFYSEAAALGKQKNFPKEECEATLNIGEMLYKKGDYESALYLFLKADSIASKNKLEPLESCALYYIGKYNQTTGNFSKAKEYYLKSLAISRKNKDNKQLALLLPSLGKYYISEGKLNTALTYYQEAFYISTQLHDRLLSADICNHLGGLYIELKEYDKAMDYHRKALQYRVVMKYPGELAKSYNNIGKIHFGLKNLDSAKYYFNKSLIICRNINYKKGLVKSLVHLGEVYRLTNQFNTSSAFLMEAFQTANKIGYDNGIAESSLGLGDLFQDKNAPDTAISYYKISLSKLLKTNYNEDLLRIYKGLYNCYKEKQEYKEALAYHVLILEIEKKLLDVENKRQLAILSITFDTERKEKDYQVLAKDNELQASLLKSKNTLIWLIIVALSFTILLCLYIYNRFYIKKRANKKLEELNFKITNQNMEFIKVNKELELVSKEKDKLFTIISHELRNPLYWLQNLAEVLSEKYDTMPADKIRKTLVSMDESAKNVYHLMDNLLHWSRSKLNRVHPKKSQHNLFALISETISMYQTFLQQKEISCFITIPKDVYIYADADLFACVIRNLLSNAIKYTPHGGKISFKCELSFYFATLLISDSGKGMTDPELKNAFAFNEGISIPGLMQEKGSGLGLKLCKDFVEINDGKIWADSIPGIGTRFFFTVPVQNPVQMRMEEFKIAEN